MCKSQLHYFLKKEHLGASLVVQWVRPHAPSAKGPGSIPGQGTRSLMHAATKSLYATAKDPHAAVKIPHVATKTQGSQNK